MATATRKCANCKTRFRPQRTFPALIAWCSDACGTALAFKRLPAQREKERMQRKEQHKADKQRIKSRADWLKEAQTAVNSYVRARDSGKACISCDKPDNGHHQRHASHYRSVKACSVLRFNLRNIHASCATCNAVLSGNLLEYRIRLVKQKGATFVEWLECQNETRRYSIEYLKRLKRIFNKRASLEKARNVKHGYTGM